MKYQNPRQYIIGKPMESRHASAVKASGAPKGEEEISGDESDTFQLVFLQLNLNENLEPPRL